MVRNIKKKSVLKKSNPRKAYTSNENASLIAEVSGDCPKCGKRLLNRRGSNLVKDYELAHIYPLNPTPGEVQLLKNEERLSLSPNEDANIVPLCVECHHKLDNPRTINDYKELVKIKKSIIALNKEKAEWQKHQLNDEITHIIKSLITLDAPVDDNGIEYDPKTIDEKTNPEIPKINRNRIQYDVDLYFAHIKSELNRINGTSPGIADYISLQIKTYYTSLKMRNISKLETFDNISAWIKLKAGSNSIEACKAITSFFIQHCEIFEVKNDIPI